MYHALEHVEDPVGILSKIRGWLPEGGRLLVEVPNVEATCIHPRHRFHFAHFYSFNQATLEATGRAAGFEPLHASTSPDGGNIITVFTAAAAPATARRVHYAATTSGSSGLCMATPQPVIICRRRRMPVPWAGFAHSSRTAPPREAVPARAPGPRRTHSTLMKTLMTDYSIPVELASERRIRDRNKLHYRFNHWPIWIFVFFIAPGPLTFDLFERGFDSRILLWLGAVMLGHGHRRVARTTARR